MAGSSETTHEEQMVKQAKRGRSRSREALADAETRLAKVELAIVDGEERFEGVEQRIEGLEKRGEELREEMQGAVNQSHDDCLRQVKTVEDTLKAEIIMLKEELAICKRAIAQMGSNEVSPTPSKVDVPKPKFYKGTRNARELENFLWGMEQYFKALGIANERAKIDTATLYLDDVARTWWRRRQGDVEKGTCILDTWEEFKK
jgi:hypothetical protein